MSLETVYHHIPAETQRILFTLIAPIPSEEAIKYEYERDHRKNPHNDHHLPKKRNTQEIIADLRIEFADVMIERLKVKK